MATKTRMARKTIAPAAPMTPDEVLQELLHDLGRDVRFAEQECNQFAAKVLADPAYAMQWCDDNFKNAATLTVARTIIAELWNRCELAWAICRDLCPTMNGQFNPADILVALRELRERAAREALRSAKYPSNSTSVGANAMHQAMGAAWADEHEKLGNLVGWLERAVREVAP